MRTGWAYAAGPYVLTQYNREGQDGNVRRDLEMIDVRSCCSPLSDKRPIIEAFNIEYLRVFYNSCVDNTQT